MIALRAGSFLALWATVLVVWSRAYVVSVNVASLDARLTWVLPPILLALLLGHLVGAALARRRGWVPLDAAGHGLCLLMAALCTLAASHVPADSTITAMRQEIPPVLGFLHPLLAALTPLVLRSRPRQQDSLLWFTLAALPLSGALLLLDGPTALCLGAVALLGQLAQGTTRRLARQPLLWTALAVVGLLALATLWGRNPLHASPSLSWILAGACTLLAVACRPRDALAARRLLTAPLVAAVVIALCGLLLTAFLAWQVEWLPALKTRLTLFRQHPNFLAPFFAFQAVVAVGLARADRRHRAWALAAGLILALSTWMTDSRSGQALLIVGLLGTAALPLLRRRLMGLGQRRATLVGATVVLLGLAALWGLDSDRGRAAFASSIDRFEKSMDYRLDAWRNATAVIEGSPWLGVGPHTFISARRFEPGSRFFNEPTSPHPHNVLLYVAQSAGLPALLLFVAWLTLLAAGLWRSREVSGAPATLPTPLADALLAAVVALLLANQLDVGLALDTVVPEPLFLITGLVLAAGVGRDAADLRPGWALLWLAGLVAIVLPFGLDGVAARRDLELARLQAYLSTPAAGELASMDEAIASAENALRLDPDLEHGYELLARWYETREGGFSDAHALLQRMAARAPRYGAAGSLLGHLYLRANMFHEAAEALTAALADEHGSIHQTRDRADAVIAMARTGRRDLALQQLVEALDLDVDVTDAIPWTVDPATGTHWLAVGGSGGVEPEAPISLFEALEILLARHRADQEAGRPVGRKNWMDLYIALRRAGRDDRAGGLLDYLESEVPSVEHETILNERGLLALDAGHPEQALPFFEQAYETTGNSFYQADILRARQRLGQTDGEIPTTSAQDGELTNLVEILDQPLAFQKTLEVLTEVALHDGDAASAASYLQRTLLYIDDLLERAERWQRIGDLYCLGEQPAAALGAYEQALRHLGAKPYALRDLQRGLDRSRPAELARSMAKCWRDLGHDPRQVVADAWSLPDVFSQRKSWSHFRAALFDEAGQMDALLREAELQLLSDPDDLLARWWQVQALEGLGRHAQVTVAMRALSEHFADQSPVALQRLYAQAVADGQQHLADPDAWRRVAVIELLRGRYDESATLYATARGLLADDQGRLSAELAGWQARAVLLSGRDDALAVVRGLLTEAVALAPGWLGLRRRLETLP